MAQQANIVQGPESCETTDLHFKQYCKLKIFDSSFKHEGGNCSLIAVSQYYGLIFVGLPNGLTVLKSKLINNSADFEKYPKMDIILNMKPTHISVDFSQKILAVLCNSKEGVVLTLYNISSFSSKDMLKPLKVISLSKLVQNLAVEVLDITWQPILEGALVVCMSDGSVLLLSQNSKDASGGSVISLPNTTQATCFCWSPKGKQIVIGNACGTLSQYKPDLKLVKTLPAPPIFDGNVIVISVLWISSFQFAVAYNDRNYPELFPIITIVNAPKNEPVNVINYDDITFSSTLYRSHQMYMSYQSSWNLIFISSANSIEVAVLHSKDSSTWIQWLLGDASRAELPLDANRQETFPLGVAFDYTSEESIPWGEGSLPPMPRILILSDEGVLSIFNIVNSTQNAPQLCASPKENIDDSLFIDKPMAPTVSQQSNIVQVSPEVTIQQKPTQTFLTGQSNSNLIAFGNSKPTFTQNYFGSNTSFGGLGIAATTSAQSQPQVTITIQGGSVIGGPKENPLIAQPPQLKIQPFQLQQQPVISSIQSTPSATSLKFSKSVPQLPTSTFSFGTSNSTSLLNTKPTVSSGNTITISPQVTAFKEKTTAQSDIFTGKTNILQSTPIKQPETNDKTATKSTQPVKKIEVSIEPLKKTEEKNTRDSPERSTPELAIVDDSVYLNALQDEIDHFNSELKHLSAKVNNLNIQIGTEEDKMNMRKILDNMYAFWKELKETTVSQTNEIHSVVTDLMESFAWLEDAKSRNLQRKNPSLIEFKKSQELDPISTRHMADIGHLKYYIENQLKQLTDHLEKEWMDHQDSYRMEIKNQMAIPPLEEVYKAMHFQLKILNRQRILVEELKDKLEAKKKKNKAHKTFIMDSNLNFLDSQNTKRTSELSKLADNLLQLKISKEDNSNKLENWEVMKAQFKAICDRSKKLTLEKQAVLRDVLSERDMVKIRPVKTTFESSSFIRPISLEKSKQQTTKFKPESKSIETNEKDKIIKITSGNSQTAKSEVNSAKTKFDFSEVQEKQLLKKPEVVFVFGGGQAAEKPVITSTPQLIQPVVSKPEQKSPLSSLSGIVSNIGKENEPKLPSTFTFGLPKSQTVDTSKASFVFGSANTKPQPKLGEISTPQTFSFGASKPSESLFGNKTELPKLETKLNFVLPTTTTIVTSSPTQPKFSKTTANVSVSVNTVTTTTASFNFSFNKPGSPGSTSLPKMNVSFGGKEQNTEFGTTTNITDTSTAGGSTQSSSSSIFANSAPIFGGFSNKPASTTSETSSYFTSMFSAPKTTTETVVRPTTFTFTLPTENKTATTTSEAITTNSSASTPTTVEILVLKKENVKKTESDTEPKKESTKVTSSHSPIFDVVSTTVKPVIENTATLSLSSSPSPSQSVSSSTPQNTQIVPASQSAATTTTTSIFTKPIIATTPTILPSVAVSQSATTRSESPSKSTFVTEGGTTVTTTGTTSVFSFTTPTNLVFGQEATTTVVTSTPVSSVTGIFEQNQKTTTTDVFGQVSSTTPTTTSAAIPATTTTTSTTNIFSAAVPSTPTTNLFGTTTPTKPVFGQVSPQTTPSSGSIFGSTVSTTSTNIFGQVTTTTTSSASVFGQSSDPVAQTANVFGQLLSDSSNNSGSVFGTTSTTPATSAKNIFSTPKNIFSGVNTTTTSLFGTTSSSIFLPSTPIFGASTTSSNVFGQSQTPASNTFFGKNVCSPFGGNTSVTSSQNAFESGAGFGSKPTFGQSWFGQTTSSNTSIFGGSSNASIFGGSSPTNSSRGNIFSAPTTSTFGSTSGPFSSGQGSVAQAGFGAANTFQKPMGGFGSPPVFGGSPSSTSGFGVAPTFGSSTTFGALPTFGRPFENTQGGFSPPQGHSTTFENLANQSTLGFGNLAQQSQNQGFGGFGSAPAFDNKPGFVKKSFSSWRST